MPTPVIFTLFLLILLALSLPASAPLDWLPWPTAWAAHRESQPIHQSQLGRGTLSGPFRACSLPGLVHLRPGCPLHRLWLDHPDYFPTQSNYESRGIDFPLIGKKEISNDYKCYDPFHSLRRNYPNCPAGNCRPVPAKTGYRARQKLETAPVRSFLVGLINVLFWFVILVFWFVWTQYKGGPDIMAFVIGTALAILLLIGLIMPGIPGVVAMARLTGCAMERVRIAPGAGFAWRALIGIGMPDPLHWLVHFHTRPA